VEIVELRDTPEQLLVEPEDVPNLDSWPDPVLGGEPEHGEPTDVALHGQPDDSRQVLLAFGVPGGPWQVSTASPTAIAVHDASDV
jgi:hypothetical protein